ncbi:hypothetical protein OAA43_00745 [bacterium]|nr:hypothetical protein [bacterium]|tara:strand:+ start:195 stop:764 length:570 start_codon:yes stop_codon:yes gene_type:complete
MSIYYKTVICTEKPVLDINDNLVRPGKYIFEVTHIDGGIIKGNLMHFGSTKKFIATFKYFTILKLMAKAQSWLIRRTELPVNTLPNYPSPPTSPNGNSRISAVEKLELTLSHFDRTFMHKKQENQKILEKTTQPECSICLGEENLNKTLSCGHKFHSKCIKDWYNKGSKTCPICRAEFKLSTSKYTIFK